MENLLCRLSLAIQEYDFTIPYQKGSLDANADALSRCVTPEVSAATQLHTHQSQEKLIAAQQMDPVVKVLSEGLHQNRARPEENGKWAQSPLRHDALYWCHDSPTAGHQGIDKSMERLRQLAYWVNMAQDVEKHCRACLTCQQSKLPKPNKAPLMSMPIGKPWQLVAVDVLEVQVYTKGNRYLLVIQDYFTKSADAILLKNQTGATITEKLVQVFSVIRLPAILHSDRGRNFESTLLQQMLNAFGTNKSHTTAYHPEEDGMVERFTRSLLQMLRSYVRNEADWEQHLPLVLYAYRTSVHSSTGVEPYVLMFGRRPLTANTGLEPAVAYDPSSYTLTLRAKMAELKDFVEFKLISAAAEQFMTGHLLRVPST